MRRSQMSREEQPESGKVGQEPRQGAAYCGGISIRSSTLGCNRKEEVRLFLGVKNTILPQSTLEGNVLKACCQNICCLDFGTEMGQFKHPADEYSQKRIKVESSRRRHDVLSDIGIRHMLEPDPSYVLFKVLF